MTRCLQPLIVTLTSCLMLVGLLPLTACDQQVAQPPATARTDLMAQPNTPDSTPGNTPGNTQDAVQRDPEDIPVAANAVTTADSATAEQFGSDYEDPTATYIEGQVSSDEDSVLGATVFVEGFPHLPPFGGKPEVVKVGKTWTLRWNVYDKKTAPEDLSLTVYQAYSDEPLTDMDLSTAQIIRKGVKGHEWNCQDTCELGPLTGPPNITKYLNYVVNVTDEGGRSAYTPVASVYSENELKIDQIAPDYGDQFGGKLIAIGGTGFSHKTKIYFGDEECKRDPETQSHYFLSSKEVLCVAPELSTGFHYVYAKDETDGSESKLDQKLTFQSVSCPDHERCTVCDQADQPERPWGQGTAIVPHVICTGQQFQMQQSTSVTKQLVFHLQANIDFADTAVLAKNFHGQLLGRTDDSGRPLYGLYNFQSNSERDQAVGLYQNGLGAVFQDLHIRGATVKTGGAFAGALAAELTDGEARNIRIFGVHVNSERAVGGAFGYVRRSDLYDVRVADSVISGQQKVGGIVGEWKLAGDSHGARKLSFQGALRGTEFIGGIAGVAESLGFEDVSVAANIEGIGQVGGIFGTYTNGEIMLAKASFRGKIKNHGHHTGGLVGTFLHYPEENGFSVGTSKAEILDFSVQGRIEGVNFVGGALGGCRPRQGLNLATFRMFWSPAEGFKRTLSARKTPVA